MRQNSPTVMKPSQSLRHHSADARENSAAHREAQCWEARKPQMLLTAGSLWITHVVLLITFISLGYDHFETFFSSHAHQQRE